jgi:hypothetical protein
MGGRKKAAWTLPTTGEKIKNIRVSTGRTATPRNAAFLMF